MKQTILLCALVLLTGVLGMSQDDETLAARQAECSEHYERGYCSKMQDPVCGSDGTTYKNECILCFHNKKSKKKVTIMFEGKCPKAPNESRRKHIIARRRLQWNLKNQIKEILTKLQGTEQRKP